MSAFGGGGTLRRALTSVRARLLMLVALAVLPALLLTLYTAQDELGRARATARTTASWFAEEEADTFGKLLEAAQQHLTTLAETSAVRERDAARCNELLIAQLARSPSYTNLGAVLPNGDRFCSGQPGAGPANLNDREYIRRAIQTRRLTVGAFGIDRTSNRRFIGVAQPVLDATGNLRSVLYAALDIARLDQLAVRAGLILPPASSVTVVDRAGVILVRYPTPEGWIGQPASDTPLMGLIANLLVQLDGRGGAVPTPTVVTAGTDLDQVERSFAAQPLAGTPDPGDLLVFVGIQPEAVLSTYRRNLIALAAVTLLVVVAAWVGGNAFLLRRLSRLTEAARRMEAGRLTAGEAADLAAAPGIDELAQLSQRFGEMAREVLAREEGLRRTVEELKVEINQTKRAREVAAITGTDYFQQLRDRANALRRSRGSLAGAYPPAAEPT